MDSYREEEVPHKSGFPSLFIRHAIFSKIFRRQLLPGLPSLDSRAFRKNQITVLNNNSGEESSASLKAGIN
jgi:hypothetical protein